ncbi:Auxin-induced protein [Macleaya cordata]|uniref:Auxin-induced protein n=1 Tax=Macleaya cordata TaxID=56857 RepID=A0A200QQS1_MACCD|nr:Auxin-induced protein [Macleaya cordata]
MGIRLPGILLHAKHMLRAGSLLNSSITASNVPKGYLTVYVGDPAQNQKKRFLVPISYLNQPSFQDLLRKAEEEFGFDHPAGGLTIPCNEDMFINLTLRLNNSRQKVTSNLTIL